jgi:hypothetical protein
MRVRGMNDSVAGLHRLIPSSLLSGKWLFVLVCYLDDSGKDPQNTVTTLAGYVAREQDWKTFETEVEPIFKRYEVPILHAVQLEGTKGCFKSWSVLKKQSFVAQISSVLAKHSMLGVSMSCHKETYDLRAKEAKGKRQANRPYTFCFNVILDWLLKDIRTGKAAWEEGVAFVLELGHENNPQAEQAFHSIRKKYNAESALRSISFVPKEDSRAVQMADLLAFYSRRNAVALVRAKEADEDHTAETMLKIIEEKGEFKSVVATDFNREGTPKPLILANK